MNGGSINIVPRRRLVTVTHRRLFPSLSMVALGFPSATTRPRGIRLLQSNKRYTSRNVSANHGAFTMVTSLLVGASGQPIATVNQRQLFKAAPSTR